MFSAAVLGSTAESLECRLLETREMKEERSGRRSDYKALLEVLQGQPATIDP